MSVKMLVRLDFYVHESFDRTGVCSSALLCFFLLHVARFIVHVRRHPGVVALQNVGNSSHWLCVDGGITRAGDGGRCCEFYVKEIRKKLM